MPIHRSYNVWKSGIILKIKKIDGPFPWNVVAVSKILKERYGHDIILKVFDHFETYEEARDSIPHIQETIKKNKFPR